MYDFNMVNVESEGHNGKSVETIKLKHLKMDVRDYNELLPVLKDLQNTSSRIVKQFHEYLSKNERKSVSLPYNMIKKFETLKSNFYNSSQLLNFQNHNYHVHVCNRDHQKNNQQSFFKKTMKSYDEKRLWMKNYILKNEGKVQEVEEEVTKNMQYEVHKYTQFRNQLNIERLEHSFENKLELVGSNQALVIKNKRLRERIQKILAQKAEKKKEEQISSQQKNTAQPQLQSPQNKANKQEKLIVSSQRPFIASFLNYYITKQFLQKEFLLTSTTALKRLTKKLAQNNQQFKLAMDILQQKVEFDNSETLITFQQHLHKQLQLGSSDQLEQITRSNRITKTDYFIYLKEVQLHCDQIIKIYGFYFQYSLQSLRFPNARKSKSASKIYKLKSINEEGKQYFNRMLMKDLLSYRQANKERILRQKSERQEQRRLQAERKQCILKQLSQSHSKEEEQSNREKVLESQPAENEQPPERQAHSFHSEVNYPIPANEEENLQNLHFSKQQEQATPLLTNQADTQLQEEQFHEI